MTKSDHGISSPPGGASPRSDTSDDLLFTLNNDKLPISPVGFELIEEIGRGGMGIIYRAREFAFDRDIALKYLQPKYEVGSVNALRFLDEARITGQLQHPGIPAVHQAGTLSDGRPFLVMKLIKGYTLSDLIWNKDGTPRKSEETRSHTFLPNYLSIFESICQAVGYAHAHGVIHRDLKPHNIMVGAFAEVQVMDWGLAKVLRQDGPPAEVDLTNHDPQTTKTFAAQSFVQTTGSELTTAGSVLGTPSYMPPEQAIGANTLLDPRSDVFGLGGILCALITGKPPFVGDTLESTRLLSALGMMTDCFDRLDASGADPDLIALAKRCLAANRDERPENAGAVARDISQLRAAADERARQAELERTKAEVLVREHRTRRRVVMISSAAIITVLLIGIVGTTWGLFQAATKEKAEAEQRKIAETKEAETRAVLDFVDNKVFAAARPEGLELGLGRNVKMRDVLEKALTDIADNFKSSPVIEARIRKTLGQSFWFLGEFPIASRELHRSLELFELHSGPYDKQTLLAMLAVANLDHELGHYQEALENRERVFQHAKEHHGISEHVTQMAMNNLTVSYVQLGRQKDVLKLAEEVHQLTLDRLGAKDAFTMLCMSNLGLAYFQSGKQTEGLKLFEEAMALQKKNLSPTHPNTLDTIMTYAACLDILGRHEQALPMHQEVLRIRQDKQGDDHPATLTSMTNLAYCYSCLGRNEDALKLLQLAVPLFEKRKGLQHAETLNCIWAKIARLFDLNRSSEAIPLIDECLKRATGPKADSTMINSLMTLRFRHFKKQRDLNQCLATVELWEKRDLNQAEFLYDKAWAWAAISTLKSEMEKASALKEADRAMVLIQFAVAAGWNDVKQLEEEKDLGVLRDREDFRLLMMKLKKAAGEKKPGTK
ncbi:MAG TPA: serine/threonine-protein kinase [Gemmatales bacterium]|nr:serine/threonine-protein kinase [Gemmatales bacterium]